MATLKNLRSDLSPGTMISKTMSQACLPADFMWGFATASYQIEGAIEADGRGPTNWDVFCQIPGKVADGSSGAVACDSYNRTAEDIALLQQIGAKAYRFSISWSRIIPLGGRNDPVNQKGIDHYVKFVDDLHAAGIIPIITLFHWDLPHELDKRYGGLLNRKEFVPDFLNYARIMFEAMGSKVKHWITFNEPFCSAVLGYGVGKFAPGHTSDRKVFPKGDSSTEPWIVGHSILLAHGNAVKLYRDEFKQRHGGEIGITLNGDWAYPYDPESQADIDACERKLEFAISWFADPIYFGKYPDSMRKQLGSRLPEFTDDEAALMKGTNDFYGMNHYCAHFIRALPEPADINDHEGNLDVLHKDKKGEYVGPETQSDWLRPNPQGFRYLLKWLTDRYGRPKIIVTENGTSIKGENDLTKDEILEDNFRVDYFKNYVKAMAEAYAQDNVNVQGYMAWSLLDNFEWADGYETRFGVTYVDYEGGQKRYPKKSAKELKSIFEQYIGKT